MLGHGTTIICLKKLVINAQITTHTQASSPLHIPHHGGNANGRVHQDIVSNPLI